MNYCNHCKMRMDICRCKPLNLTPFTEPSVLQEALDAISKITLFEVIDATMDGAVKKCLAKKKDFNYLIVDVSEKGICITGSYYRISLISRTQEDR